MSAWKPEYEEDADGMAGITTGIGYDPDTGQWCVMVNGDYLSWENSVTDAAKLLLAELASRLAIEALDLSRTLREQESEFQDAAFKAHIARVREKEVNE